MRVNVTYSVELDEIKQLVGELQGLEFSEREIKDQLQKTEDE